MNRRAFTFGSAIFALGAFTGIGAKTRRAAFDLIRKLERARRPVGTPQPGGGLQIDIPDVTGWDLELEEDDNVIWDLVATNHGPKAIRVVYCKPFTLGPAWQIVERLPVPVGSSGRRIKRWRACNEDHFFFVEVETSSNVWVQMDGEPANSDANLNDAHTGAHMSWNRPQPVALGVQLARGQHGSC